jgi:hypothetical protein
VAAAGRDIKHSHVGRGRRDFDQPTEILAESMRIAQDVGIARRRILRARSPQNILVGHFLILSSVSGSVMARFPHSGAANRAAIFHHSLAPAKIPHRSAGERGC